MNRAAREEKLRAVPPASAEEPPIATAPPGKAATTSATGRGRGLNSAKTTKCCNRAHRHARNIFV